MTRTHFFQILEGQFETVMKTMSRIRSDDRHESIELLQVVPVTECEFGIWSLAVAELDLSKGPLTAEILGLLHRGERCYLKAMHKLALDVVMKCAPPPVLAGDEVRSRPQ